LKILKKCFDKQTVFCLKGKKFALIMQQQFKRKDLKDQSTSMRKRGKQENEAQCFDGWPSRARP
jgi:hypothetical protein